MLGREYFELWECGLCGTRHDERGKHNFTLAVEIPPMEDDGCGYSCPLLRSDEDGEYCRNGLELPADVVRPVVFHDHPNAPHAAAPMRATPASSAASSSAAVRSPK